MRLNHKLIVYRAIMFIPLVAIFPFLCIGFLCEWIADRYADFGVWLQSKIFK